MADANLYGFITKENEGGNNNNGNGGGSKNNGNGDKKKKKKSVLPEVSGKDPEKMSDEELMKEIRRLKRSVEENPKEVKEQLKKSGDTYPSRSKRSEYAPHLWYDKEDDAVYFYGYEDASTYKTALKQNKAARKGEAEKSGKRRKGKYNVEKGGKAETVKLPYKKYDMGKKVKKYEYSKATRPGEGGKEGGSGTKLGEGESKGKVPSYKKLGQRHPKKKYHAIRKRQGNWIREGAK